MEDFEIEYFLLDDDGFTCLYLPIILQIGTIFKNEFKEYKVMGYALNNKELQNIYCQQIK